jgi:ABC-2 type transport system ATP-binding protein
MDVIELHGLKKYYGKSPGIEDVTFSVKEGELFGFVGPNGAGKSTTIKLLLNFLFPTAGTASIMGKDVSRESKAIKRFTSYVSGDVRLYGDMTVNELLKTSGSFYGIRNGSEKERLCELFEIDGTKRFFELSMGNRKKTAIVLALLSDPRVIILDEPTNGLDPVMKKKMFDELKKRTENGLTVLLSSHNLAEVQEYCDRAAFIKRGRVLAVTDLHEALRARKVVTVWSDEPFELKHPAAAFMNRSGNKQVFRYEGTPDGLLKALSSPVVTDFTVENESLEDRFMSLYEEEAAK